MAQTTLQDSLAEIAGLARAGRLLEASLLAARMAPDAGQDPVFHSLAGAIEFHLGRFDKAASLLGVAQRQLPADLTVRTNLVEALVRSGQDDAAYALADDAALAAEGPPFRLARLTAHLAQERGDFARAVALYRRILAADGQDWSLWNNLGNALSGIADHAAAADALERALKLAPDSQPVRVNLGNALAEAGRFDEGIAMLREAAAADPADPQPLRALFTLFGLVGAEDESFAAIAEAAARAPTRADLQLDLAQEAVRRNLFEQAEASFEAVLQLTPDEAQAYVGLATVYERLNREADLDPLRDRAAAAGAGAKALSFIDALRFKRADRMDDAWAALDAAGDIVAPGRLHHLRGVILDRLGRYDEAWAEFEAMNAHWLDDPVRPAERAAEYRKSLNAATERLTAPWVASWRTDPIAPAPYPTPIFLGGFPRSGTTLLDTMLMTDPAVRVLEEEAIIGEIEQELGGMDALPALDGAALARARALYFEKAGQIVDLAPGVRIVDKHPLHGNKAEVIHRLFPDAKHVLALRHPCDVLLSCFLTNFRNNHAMANFLSLDTAAEVYDQTFSHWERARTLLELDVHTVVYERLVADTERELRPLFAWAGLTFPQDRFDHTGAARTRGLVTTASYAQVTEPVYQRAAGRWTRYARHLAPILPRLAAWIAHHGYGLEDGRHAPWPHGAIPA